MQWKNDLLALTKVKISRFYKFNEKKSSQAGHGDMKKWVIDIQIHNLSAASVIGYGAASYIRTEFIDGKWYALLPLRKVSAPCLELQATVLTVNLHNAKSTCHSVRFITGPIPKLC